MRRLGGIAQVTEPFSIATSRRHRLQCLRGRDHQGGLRH